VKLKSAVWIAGITMLALAGPAYPQNKTELAVLQLQRDMITLQNQMKEMQSSLDQNNKNLTAMVEKLADQLNTLNTNLPKLTDAVTTSARTENEKTAAEIRSVVSGLKDSLDQINQGLNGRDGVRAQVSNLSQQVKDMRAAAATEPLATPEDLMRTAHADFSAGNWNLAVGEYKEFLGKYPTHPRAAEAQLQIGEAFFNQKKYEQAITEYDIVLQKYPKDDKTVTALYKEGLAYWELGQPEKAIAAMNRVVMEYPGSPESTFAKQKLAEWKPPTPARGRRG
jgi:tol-pal system protein YbgF